LIRRFSPGSVTDGFAHPTPTHDRIFDAVLDNIEAAVGQ
jgi:hypothetical protein